MMRIANISFLAYRKRHDRMVESKGLQTVGCYEPLAQTKYKELLQYVPNAYRNKHIPSSEYAASDKLRQYIDYPYLRDD